MLKYKQRGVYMRVSRVSVNYQQNNYQKSRNLNYCNPPCTEEPKVLENTNFKGKFGAWLGGITGTAAVVAAAVLAAPAAICLAGGGAIVGAIGGHVVEDAVNGTNNNE